MLHSHFALHFILFCQAPLGRHLGVRLSFLVLSCGGNPTAFPGFFSGIGVFHMKPLKKIGNGDINGDISQWKPWKPLDFWEYHTVIQNLVSSRSTTRPSWCGESRRNDPWRWWVIISYHFKRSKPLIPPTSSIGSMSELGFTIFVYQFFAHFCHVTLNNPIFREIHPQISTVVSLCWLQLSLGMVGSCTSPKWGRFPTNWNHKHW